MSTDSSDTIKNAALLRATVAALLKELGMAKGIRLHDDPRLISEIFSEEELEKIVIRVLAMSEEEQLMCALKGLDTVRH